MISLDLANIQDQVVRDNMRKIQDFLNARPAAGDTFQACEIYVTENTAGLKIKHALGQVPLDCLVSRLIAPSAAKLKINFSDFSRTEVSVDVTGLASGETLSARLFVGTFPNVVTVGTVSRADTEVQELKGKF